MLPQTRSSPLYSLIKTCIGHTHDSTTNDSLEQKTTLENTDEQNTLTEIWDPGTEGKEQPEIFQQEWRLTTGNVNQQTHFNLWPDSLLKEF